MQEEVCDQHHSAFQKHSADTVKYHTNSTACSWMCTRECTLKKGPKMPSTRLSLVDYQSSVKQHTTGSLLAEKNKEIC